MYITLAHGVGGSDTKDLIDRIFIKRLANPILNECEDAAVIDPRKYAVSTDGFTVTPLFFNGGNIGKLAVAGSCNDIVVMGAKPLYMTASFILEEGLP
ncbi:MAG: hydrogenase expression/formation protein HypE, partial [Helicobacteraceae bacterium]|nr:hydrogenase expression/formation protein HypE [Helicobacteraceae bacterium]